MDKLTVFLNRQVRKNYLVIGIVLIGFLLRVWNFQELFMYSHDQDLSAWAVLDIWERGHLRLIGQETSVSGVFIGAGYYYLLIPFYLLFGMSPLGGVFLSIILGVFGVFSCYFVFKYITNERIALVGSLIYATSFLVVMTEREVVPTMPVFLWTSWYLYSLGLILKGKQQVGFILSAFLIGLAWHLNLALIILAPLIIMAFVFSKKKLDLRAAFWGGIVLFVTNMPLLLFEMRHGFSQTKAIVGALMKSENVSIDRLAKFDRVMQLVVTNVNRIFGMNLLDISHLGVFYVAIGIVLFVGWAELLGKKIWVLMATWLVLIPLFFTFNSINTSEYYLNAMTIVWILLVSTFIVKLRDYKKEIAWIVLAFIVGLGIKQFWGMNINRSGYVEKRQLVREIKKDALVHGFPCVSVSYITDPGYDMGYRYLYRLEKMHVNRPSSESPVYSIVFPHSKVDRIDKSFGALGLIFPDYGRYNEEKVKETCSGANSNLTDPLFGFPY